MRRAQVVTAACAALMWTAAAGVPMAAAQSGGSGAGSGAGSTQGSNQGGSSTGATAAPTSMGGAQTATGTTAAGATDTKAGGNNDVQQFVQKATIANMAEIQLGQLASQHAQDPQVKQFAQMMVDDHTRALEQLRTLASSQGLQVASELDGKHQKLHDKLSKLQGAEFDRAYMDAMVDAHKDTEKLLKSRAGKNASASASNMGQSGSTAGGNTSSTGAQGTSGATGTTGTSGSSSGGSATAGASGSSGGTTATPSAGAPGTSATTGTSGATGSSAGASSGASSAGSMTAPSSADEWAAMTLPKVRAHLEQARSLEDQVKQSGKSNNGNDSGASPAGGPGTGSTGSGSTGSGSTSGGSTPPRP